MDKPQNVIIYATLYRNVFKNIFYDASVIISLNIDDRSILNSPAVLLYLLSYMQKIIQNLLSVDSLEWLEENPRGQISWDYLL